MVTAAHPCLTVVRIYLLLAPFLPHRWLPFGDGESQLQHLNRRHLKICRNFPLYPSRCGFSPSPSSYQLRDRSEKLWHRRDLLIGQLTYHRTSGVLCSVCQAMEVAVASRPWFVEARYRCTRFGASLS